MNSFKTKIKTMSKVSGIKISTLTINNKFSNRTSNQSQLSLKHPYFTGCQMYNNQISFTNKT